MKSFTKVRKELKFEIDGDVFEAAPALPADTLMDFATQFEGMDENDGAKAQLAMVTVLETVLVPESFQHFRARMGDPQQPIELDQVNDVVQWIMSEYGMRPTLPSERSSDGSPSPESGTSSTENTQAEVSISAISLPTDS